MSDARRLAAAAIAMAFLVGGLMVEWQLLRSDRQLDAQVDLLAGWVVGGAGLAAWVAAPRSRIGPLLIGAGAAWFVGTVVGAGGGRTATDLQRLAAVLVQAHAGFIVMAVATWPSGRITRGTQRVLVVGGWVAALFPQVWYDKPGYLVLGAMLALGLVVDDRTLTPARQAARRPALGAGLALAAGLMFIPVLGPALRDLDWMLLASTGRLWAGLVAGVAVVLAATLIARQRRGSVADLAVHLGEHEPAGFGPALERAVRDAAGSEAVDDPELAAALRRAASLAERNVKLRSELAARVAELAASRRRLIEVGAEERLALVERLRTGVGARLEVLEADLGRVLTASAEAEVSPGVDRLSRATAQLAIGRAELHALSLGLDPGRVAELGLERALRDLATDSPVPIELSLGDAGRPDPSVSATLYFVASEALANVVRHARARSAWLGIRADPRGWDMTVADDGIGGADVAAGSGLRGLQERVEALGGVLEVAPRAGGGTLVRATVPAATGRDA